MLVPQVELDLVVRSLEAERALTAELKLATASVEETTHLLSTQRTECSALRSQLEEVLPSNPLRVDTTSGSARRLLFDCRLIACLRSLEPRSNMHCNCEIKRMGMLQN
jgi:hypothetical protein